MTPTTKTRHTLRVLKALCGVIPATLLPLRGAHESWRDMSDTWLFAPNQSPNPAFWKLQAQFEDACRSPDQVFKPVPMKGWAFEEVEGPRYNHDGSLSCTSCGQQIAKSAGAVMLGQEHPQPCKCGAY